MNENSTAAFHAVQESVVNLLDLIGLAARGQGEKELEALTEEAQTTVLMLVAAIVLADKKYDAGEEAFINLLVDWSRKPGGASRYLNEYAERWKTASLTLPRFFQAAVVHDTEFSTDLAGAMIREIQLIGNNTCVCDGHFDARENDVVSNYMLFLEEYLKTWKLQNPKKSEGLATGWGKI